MLPQLVFKASYSQRRGSLWLFLLFGHIRSTNHIPKDTQSPVQCHDLGCQLLTITKITESFKTNLVLARWPSWIRALVTKPGDLSSVSKAMMEETANSYRLSSDLHVHATAHSHACIHKHTETHSHTHTCTHACIRPHANLKKKVGKMKIGRVN